MHHPLGLRTWLLRSPLLLLLAFCGCMASESQSGDSFVYKKTILNTLLLLGIAVAMLVFGVGILKESLQKPKRKKSKPTKPVRLREQSHRSQGKRREPEPASSNKITGGLLLGGGLIFGGVLILLLGVPSSLVQHITVSPDKVEMRISTLWFAKGTREIPYSQISGIEKNEAEVMARRGKRKKETLILYLDSGTEFIEMGPMEKAAYPKLVEMYEAYRTSQNAAPDNTNIAQNEPAVIPNLPHQPLPPSATDGEEPAEKPGGTATRSKAGHSAKSRVQQRLFNAHRPPGSAVSG